MLRPVLPFNLIPRDEEKVDAGVAGPLPTFAFALLLELLLPDLILFCRPLLCCRNIAWGETLIAKGPAMAREFQSPKKCGIQI